MMIIVDQCKSILLIHAIKIRGVIKRITLAMILNHSIWRLLEELYLKNIFMVNNSKINKSNDLKLLKVLSCTIRKEQDKYGKLGRL